MAHLDHIDEVGEDTPEYSEMSLSINFNTYSLWGLGDFDMHDSLSSAVDTIYFLATSERDSIFKMANTYTDGVGE